MMTTPSGTPVVEMNKREALLAAAALLRNGATFKARRATALYDVMSLTGARAAVRGQCFAAVRQVVLGSSAPGAVDEQLKTMSPEVLAQVCELAAAVP
jgi:hypothetical protein